MTSSSSSSETRALRPSTWDLVLKLEGGTRPAGWVLELLLLVGAERTVLEEERGICGVDGWSAVGGLEG